MDIEEMLNEIEAEFAGGDAKGCALEDIGDAEFSELVEVL
jgi:hypothetical protein